MESYSESQKDVSRVSGRKMERHFSEFLSGKDYLTTVGHMPFADILKDYERHSNFPVVCYYQ